MDTDTVVVASVVCQAQSVAMQVSELPGICGDIGLDPGTPFQKHEDMSDVTDLWTFVDDGSEGPSLVDTSGPPVSVSVVDSGPAPPDPEFGDELRLPDFSSDIDLGPGETLPEAGNILAWPAFIGAPELGTGRPLSESWGIPDQPSFVNNFDTESGKSFPHWSGMVEVRLVGCN